MPTTFTSLTQLLTINTRYNINRVTFFTETKDRTLIIPDTSLFAIYSKLLGPYVKSYQVSESQRRFYRYRPYLLSHDIYGTPDLGWLILALNDKECASKFYLKKTINLIPQNVIDTAYDTIVTRSSDKLKANWNKYLINVGEDVASL